MEKKKKKKKTLFLLQPFFSTLKKNQGKTKNAHVRIPLQYFHAFEMCQLTQKNQKEQLISSNSSQIVFPKYCVKLTRKRFSMKL